MLKNKYSLISKKNIHWIVMATVIPYFFSDQADAGGNFPVYNPVTIFMASTSVIGDFGTNLNESPDSVTEKLGRCYSEWTIATQDCGFLLATATAGGYDVTPQELFARLSCYAEAFPGVQLDTEQVKKEIIIEKYLTQETGIRPFSQQIQECYLDYTRQCPLTPSPSQNVISPILSSRVLLTMDAIVQWCNEKSLQQPQDNEQLAESMEPWSFREIGVHADPQQCLVINPKNSRCLVSVNDFNSFLSLHPMGSYLRLDVARSMALNDYLTELYLAEKGQQAGIASQEELIKTQEQLEESKLLKREYPFSAESFDDDQLLMSTYKKYFNRFFGEKLNVTIGLIGSTDSFYIDSLYRTLIKYEEKNASHGIVRRKSYCDSLPWIAASSVDLPDTIISTLDTLKPGIQSGVLKTSMGFFIGRIFAVKRQREIPFKLARAKLIYLVLTEQARSKGKSDSVLALEYYRNHSKKFITPDTLISRAWLVPLTDATTFQTMNKKMLQQIITRDTTSFRSRIIGSNSLPVDVADTLFGRLKETKDNDKFFGPLFTRFGTWYFSIQKVIPGGKKIPFVSVRETIYKELEIQSFPFDSILKTEVGARLKTQSVMAGAYRRYSIDNIKKEIEGTPDKEIQRLIDNKTIKMMPGKNLQPDARMLSSARTLFGFKKVQQEQAEIKKWIDSLTVDRAVLFTGCSNVTRE